MKISTKGRYSVRFMIDLAMYGDKGPVLMKDISRRQDISEKYLGHFVPALKNAGLISATRGANGGFVLAKPAREITLLQIIEAVEGPVCLVGCVKDPESCRRTNTCASRDFWGEATNALIKVFESYTLQELADRQQVFMTEAFAFSI